MMQGVSARQNVLKNRIYNNIHINRLVHNSLYWIGICKRYIQSANGDRGLAFNYFNGIKPLIPD